MTKPTVEDHPCRSDLRAFASGGLDDNYFETLAAHVESCDQCAIALRNMAAEPLVLSSKTPAQSMMADMVGWTIGPYRLIRQLGEGGMGVVYEAHCVGEPRDRVALKFFKSTIDHPQWIAQMAWEKGTLDLLDHPSIVKADRMHPVASTSCFAMELVEGCVITDVCHQGRLSLDAIVDLFSSVCEGVQHAHDRGVYHCDLKPSNVLASYRNGVPRATVIDFGIAHRVESTSRPAQLASTAPRHAGTISYMSPEQAARFPDGIDPRTDVYSLGVLLYEMLTGMKQSLDPADIDTLAYWKTPCLGERLPEPPRDAAGLGATSRSGVMPQFVPRPLRAVVLRALEPRREDRYPSPAELAAAVKDVLPTAREGAGCV